MLGSCAEPLATAHDVAMLDLDGVVYVGDAPVPHAGEAIAAARERGLRIAFITNNASRPPEKVAAKIVKAGVPADRRRGGDLGAGGGARAGEPVRRRCARRGPRGARAWCRRSRPRDSSRSAVDDESAVALVTGYGPDVVWRDVMRAAVRVRDGLPWVASNTDETIPTAFGIAPGHGVMVRMLRDFTGVEPEVAGKPARPLLDETVARTGAQQPLMVGDRLDTDIEGAVRLGIPALLVMTGVTHLADLVAAPVQVRPTYISADLRGLLEPHAAPERDDVGWRARRVGRDGDRRAARGDRGGRAGRLVARGGCRVVGASRRQRVPGRCDRRPGPGSRRVGR